MTQIYEAAGIDAGKSTQQLFGERITRVKKAMALEQPDRVPILLGVANGLAQLSGHTHRELYENGELQNQSLLEVAQRFQPDLVTTYPFGPQMSVALGDQMTKWPGYGLDDRQPFQFHEQEFMKAEDYDEFLNDLGDWTIRKYLPRAYKELAGLAMLPPLGLLTGGHYSMTGQLQKLAMVPPIVNAAAALQKGAQARVDWIGRMIGSIKLLAQNGFPPSPLAGPVVSAPFDFMANTLRGMKGIFLDMRRCPEKLLAAEEKLIDMQVKTTAADCKFMQLTSAMMFLHRGSDGFISIKDFEKFYWPQLKACIIGLTEAGIVPFIFWEGVWDQRLKYLTELPKGKTVGAFQDSDLNKVKDVLGDTMCIVGGMKVSMLSGGATVQEIRNHTRQLCQGVAKGGGFIMCTNIMDLEGCKPELIQAWIDATKEFGQY